MSSIELEIDTGIETVQNKTRNEKKSQIIMTYRTLSSDFIYR